MNIYVRFSAYSQIQKSTSLDNIWQNYKIYLFWGTFFFADIYQQVMNNDDETMRRLEDE